MCHAYNLKTIDRGRQIRYHTQQLRMLSVLKKLGLSDKQIAVYVALLTLGSGSVRTIGVAAKVNRGTTYDILRALVADGLVSYIHKDKKQFFIIESPAQLTNLIKKQNAQLEISAAELAEAMPEFLSVHKRGGEKPVVRYFEGKAGIRALLTDILAVMSAEKIKQYFVYSSSSVRDELRACYPQFSHDRISKKIWVKAIAVGDGGSTHGLDERKWLSKTEGSPTYTLVYAGHVAHVAKDAGGLLVGVIIQNQAMYESQRQIFEALWARLKS